MKRFFNSWKAIVLIWVVGIGILIAADLNVTPLRPQDTDSTAALMLRQTEAMARGTLSASVEFARPADTAAYVTGDVISTNTTAGACLPLCFTNVVPSSGGGIVVKVRVSCSNKLATWPSQLWLYASSNLFLQADNAGFNPKWSNNVVRLGPIEIPALSAQTGASTDFASAINEDARLGFNIGDCVVTNRCLFGYLVIKGGYTPASNTETNEVKIVVLGQ